MNHHYRGLFEDWEIGVTTNVIERHRNQWKCLKTESFEDLLQECLLHWLYRKDRYNPASDANERTFMARVVKNKLGHIVEKLTSNKRKALIDSLSLNDPISQDEGSPTFLDQLSEDEVCSSNLRVTAELKIDISQTIQKLTPKQQELCRLLNDEGLNINQASKAMQIPRGTLYEDIKRIRTIFQQEGLHEYL